MIQGNFVADVKKNCIDKSDAKCIFPRKWICSNKVEIDVGTLLPFNFQLVRFVNWNKFIDRMEVNVNSLNTVFSLNIKYSLDANGNFIFDVFISWLWFCPIFRLHKFPIEYCVNFITPQIPHSFNSFVKLKTDFWANHLSTSLSKSVFLWNNNFHFIALVKWIG